MSLHQFIANLFIKDRKDKEGISMGFLSLLNISPEHSMATISDLKYDHEWDDNQQKSNDLKNEKMFLLIK